jgi:hypothetical protein
MGADIAYFLLPNGRQSKAVSLIQTLPHRGRIETHPLVADHDSQLIGFIQRHIEDCGAYMSMFNHVEQQFANRLEQEL